MSSLSVSESTRAPAAGTALPAVSVQDVSVTYRTTFERVPTFKGALVRFGRGERAIREIEAVKNVSFEVPRGQAMGIIGANGAGKSTLMRTLAGILPPTRGRIECAAESAPCWRWVWVSTLLCLGGRTSSSADWRPA